MSGASVTVELGDLIPRLNQLKESVGDMTDLMNAIGGALVTDIDRCFMESRDPWGVPWVALSETTKSRRRKGAKKGATEVYAILVDTGILQNAQHQNKEGVRFDSTRLNVNVGVNLEYAATHQFGRADNKMFNNAKGHPAPIPARPFLPLRGDTTLDLPPEVEEEIKGYIEKFIDDKLAESLA
jgi:phage virion morphogenesis protein